jgi:hypothetical protein
MVIYGYGNLSLTLREKHELRMFEKRVLRRIFGLERDEVAAGQESCIRRSFVTGTLKTNKLRGP